MALTEADVLLWRALGELGVIPEGPRVLEIGQANWYGDTEPPEDCRDADRFVVARKFYKKVLNYAVITAVDFHGPPDALKYDLNQPLPLPTDHQFDIVINTGTAEHIFDQRQLMQTIHERCAVDGLMVHAAPRTGWDNHGFFNYHPCFFVDLAAANRYEILYDLLWTCGHQYPGEDVPRESTMMYLALRKTRDEPFRVPQQSRYAVQ